MPGVQRRPWAGMMIAFLLTADLAAKSSDIETVDIIFAGGQSNATEQWARGIEDALVASGMFTNLQMVHTYHPGNWMIFFF